MNKYSLYIICLTILVLGNCSLTERKKPQESNTESLYDLIPILFDSVFIDVTLMPPPPPPLWKMTRKDSLQYRIAYDDYLNKKDQNPDTVLLAIQDQVFRIDDPEKLLKQHFDVTTPIIVDSINSPLNKLDLNKISLPKRFILRPISAFPKGLEIWREDFGYELAGAFSISNIEMDTTKTYGVVEWGFTCGGTCGRGGYAYLINKNGKWIIDQIVTNWVS